MNREEIIEMDNQAGIVSPQMVIKTLESFAKLVAQHEREACAKVCFDFKGEDPLGVSLDCAYAIRARGIKHD